MLVLGEPSAAALRSAEVAEGMGRGFVWMFVFSERCESYGTSKLFIREEHTPDPNEIETKGISVRRYLRPVQLAKSNYLGFTL